MSDRRNYSPSERDDARMDDPYGRDWSDDEYSGGPRGREKFRRERSIEGDHGTSASRHDDFDRYDRKKRPRRSITPPEERRRYKRRSSYSRGASPSPYPDGDCYIPNYSRDGYSPAPRYSSLRKGSEPNSSFGGFPDMMSMMGPNWPMGRSASFDLEQLDHVVSFKQFCEHLRRTHPRSHFDEEDLQQRYQRYREKQQAKQLAKFFANNKEKQWFKEKYHPAISRDRIKQTKERRLQYLKSFLMELSEGKYDNVQYDATDGSTEEESTSDLKEEENENDTEKSNGDSSAADAQEFENYLVIKTVSPTIARDRIIEVCAGVEGFEYLALSEPSPTKKFHRIGWIHFKEGTDMQKAFEELDNRKVDDFTLHLAMNRKGQNTAKSFKFAPESANTLHRLRKDLEQARKLARVFESELDGAADGLAAVCERAKRVINEHESENSERDEKDKDEEEKWALKKELDMITAYLRQVHMYCYYCALECDSLEEINRRCVNPHRRAQKTSSGNKNDKHLNQFFKNLDHKVSLKLHRPEGRDLERLGGKLEQRELDKFVQEHVQKEHEAKYKCQVGDCSKAFKGLEYVEKHIFAKHKEETDKIKEETEFFNNYICDPNHLVSSITGGSNAVGMVMPSMGAMPIGMTPFMMPGMRMQGAVPGTPLDQIPRIGFIDNGWPAAAAAGRGGSIYDRLGRPNRNGMDLDEDMPRDPRQVKSYVDLDAPAEGDADISFY